MVCLGDHAQGGPQPAECLERLRDLECPAVMGNSDDFLLTLDPGDEPVTEAQLETARWSQAQLSEEQLDFHRSFQPTVELDLAAVARCSPSTARRGRATRSSARGWKRRPFASRSRASTRRCSPVATHQQWARRLGDRYYVNPGSVGLAYDHHQPEESFRADPCAEYAVLTVNGPGVGVEFRRVPFDAGAVIEAIEASGMPHADLAARFWR